MNKTLTTSVLSIALLATGAAWTQMGPPHGRGRGAGFGAGAAVTPDQQLERRLEFMAGYLGLTDAQKAQIKAAFQLADQKTQPLVQQMQEIQTKLRDAVRANAPAQTIQTLAESKAKLHVDLTMLHAQTAATVRNLLTTEQRAKLDALGGGCGCCLGMGFGFGGRGRSGW